MSQNPIPVIVISSRTSEGSTDAIKALELGAVDIMCKPQVHQDEFLEESRILICDAIKAASKAKITRTRGFVETPPPPITVQPKFKTDAVLAKTFHVGKTYDTNRLIAIGASTGGTEALRAYLETLPEDSPGTVIVQHMPEKFTYLFAKRLNDLCKVTVKEAENGDEVRTGLALIAPGNRHMIVKRRGTGYYVELLDGSLVNRHKPSVDVLFRSVANCASRNAIGIIMTGMGDDGARGLLEMKEAGAHTIAQDEKSCVVFGMPKEAIKLNAADVILPLGSISNYVINHK
jgi:two-component system chemotaxis response regulator CheB